MRFFILLTLFSFISFSSLHSQSSNDYDVDPSLISRFDTSIDYLNSFKVDSAGLILDSIITVIKGTKVYDSPFGLNVQLRKAIVLERDTEEDSALIALQDIKVKAFETQLWNVYALANINLGLVYEKIGKGKDCIQNLRDAQRILNDHPTLDHIYPFFCVRISSYHRIYDDRDSAKHYAQECLRTYEQFDEYAQGGDGYMLMTFLADGPDERIKYAKAAVKIFTKLENHNALSYMISNISRFYYKKGDLQKALLYNDSTTFAAQRSLDGGYDVYHALYSAYKFRAEIYSKKGQLDSAYHYVIKGYELHNQHILNENYNKVLEIDSKYKDDKKVQKIKDQEEQLNSQNIQRRLLMIIFALITFFTGGLIYYYNKLMKAKHQTEQQAALIKTTNKELSTSLNKQIVLQGEVHHRVKNNLQVIISLLDLQKEEAESETAKGYIDSMSKRIYSMAAIHNLLYQKEDMEFIKLHNYIENLCYHFSNFSLKRNKPIFDLVIDDIDLNLETSMPIGIIITELLTNSLKYGRIEGQKLKIDVTVKLNGEEIIIYYRDNGTGFNEDPKVSKSKGLGFYILDSMTRQLQGKLIRKNDSGASYEIHLIEKNNVKGEEYTFDS